MTFSNSFNNLTAPLRRIDTSGNLSTEKCGQKHRQNENIPYYNKHFFESFLSRLLLISQSTWADKYSAALHNLPGYFYSLVLCLLGVTNDTEIGHYGMLQISHWLLLVRSGWPFPGIATSRKVSWINCEWCFFSHFSVSYSPIEALPVSNKSMENVILCAHTRFPTKKSLKLSVAIFAELFRIDCGISTKNFNNTLHGCDCEGNWIEHQWKRKKFISVIWTRLQNTTKTSSLILNTGSILLHA